MAHSPSPSRRRLTRVAGLALLSSLAVAAPAAADDGQILRENAPGAIPDSYIVVLDDDAADADVNALSREHKAKVRGRFKNAVNGFSATMSRKQALELSADPSVAFVEQNQTFSATAVQANPPSWGLDRVDQRDLPLNSSFTYSDSAGTGVTAYIIDTGIRVSHSAFGGRATWGTNTVDTNNTDCHGHGTHVAGTVGGAQYGVAKNVQLVAVKVLGCNGSGTTAGVIAGVDWVTGRHAAGAPAVANMSLGGSSSAALDNAVKNSIADGVTYALAAGNESQNACNVSPARTAEAITVGATTQTDARASFSNFGSCVDLFAPGQGITSAWIGNDSAINTISGTSMASPHVAGAAALILGATPGATPAQVRATMVTAATVNKVTSAGSGSPNLLLNTGSAPVSPTPTPTPGPAPCVGTNGTDVLIPDLTTVASTIAISGCNRNASATAQVAVNILHTYRGDLVVDLVAPNGAVINLSNRSGAGTDNINQTYTVNLSAYPANGAWSLRVRDAATADTGRIDSWGLTL
jgi:subtilisin family serine protease